MSQNKPTVLLEYHLKQLKLPSMLREYTSLAAVCSKERADYPTYLLRLSERSLVRQLAGGEYIDRRENVLLAGNSGTGKTHLATALGFTACAQGRRVRFFTVTGLVTYLLEAREDRQLQRILEQLGRHQLLILDELGYVPFSKAGAELLFEVVSRAYEQTSLIVTTNLPFENWTEVMGSERLTGALLDRLSHRIHILEANGQSYRLKESRQRLKSSKPISDQRKTDDQTEEEK
jgi:DNA replication protein DnaC